MNSSDYTALLIGSVTAYYWELLRDNVLVKPLKHFVNRINGINERKGMSTLRFERYCVIANALSLIERGNWFYSECVFNENFFVKKLNRSELSRHQFQKWKVDAKEAIKNLNMLQDAHYYDNLSITDIELQIIIEIPFLLKYYGREMQTISNNFYGTNEDSWNGRDLIFRSFAIGHDRSRMITDMIETIFLKFKNSE